MSVGLPVCLSVYLALVGSPVCLLDIMDSEVKRKLRALQKVNIDYGSSDNITQFIKLGQFSRSTVKRTIFFFGKTTFYVNMDCHKHRVIFSRSAILACPTSRSFSVLKRFFYLSILYDVSVSCMSSKAMRLYKAYELNEIISTCAYLSV